MEPRNSPLLYLEPFGPSLPKKREKKSSSDEHASAWVWGGGGVGHRDRERERFSLPKLETLGFTARVKPRKQSSVSVSKSQRFNSRFGEAPAGKKSHN